MYQKREIINVIDYDDSDKIYHNKMGFEFKIINKVNDVKIINGNKRWRTKYLIKFVETGTEKLCDIKEICNGGIKDVAAPYVCKVGIVGTEIELPQSHYLYDRWRDMLRRCYDKKSKSYISYGACGITVCDEWKYFPNFVRDIENKENHEKLKERHTDPNMRYEIDKDLIKTGNKVYCNEFCSIITHKENLDERNSRNKYNKETNQKAVWRVSKDFTQFRMYECITDSGIDTCGDGNFSTIFDVLCGKCNSAYGYYWRRVEDFQNIDSAICDIKKRLSVPKNYNYLKTDYILIDECGNVIKEFTNMLVKDLAKELNISSTHTSRCLNNNTKYKNTYILRRKVDV